MMVTRNTPSIHTSMDIVGRGRTSSLSGPRTHIAYHMLSVNTRAAVTLSQAGEITITVPDVMFRLNRRTLVTPQVRQFAFAHLHLLPVKTAAESWVTITFQEPAIRRAIGDIRISMNTIINLGPRYTYLHSIMFDDGARHEPLLPVVMHSIDSEQVLSVGYRPNQGRINCFPGRRNLPGW